MYFYFIFCYNIRQAGIGMKKLSIKRKINSLYIAKRIKRIGGASFLDFDDREFNIEDYLSFGEWNEMVKEFDQKFRDNFTEKQRENFKKNIRDVIIRKKRLSDKEKNKNGTRGLYDPSDNSIRVYANNKEEEFYIKERLTHELMHMASRKDKYNCGFHYFQKGEQLISIGRRLNEGYTEFLNAAYMTYDYKGPYYVVEKVFAHGIEKIVGKEVMRDAYFEGNLLKLVEAMSEYMSNKDALNLIYDMDKLDYSKSEKEYEKGMKKIKKKISKIVESKIKRQLENGIIDIEEFEKRKFYDVEMYNKYNFIYSDTKKVYIQEYNDSYKVISDFNSVCLDKKKVPLKFDSDVKILR